MPYDHDYPEIPLELEKVRAGLRKCKEANLITMVAFDDRIWPDMSYLKPVLQDPEIRSMIDWCMGIYEVNGVVKNPDTVLSILKQTRDMLPDVVLAVHFTPVDEGRDSYGHVDWNRAKKEAGLNAFLFQSAGWEFTPEEVAARVADFTRRLQGGFHGYPILSHGVNVYELTTSRTYRYQWTEQLGVDFTDKVMNAPLVPDEGFMSLPPNGFGDGGTVV